ncbi:MAG TPA: tyrosinase family protein [Lysobacter sp.]|nr:tyrosinase family protein [Lysobacter sp.]
MNTFTRRDFLTGLAALPLTLALPRTGRAQTTTTPLLVRYDCASPEGLDMLQTFADTVRHMQSLGPDNPMSWMWQWYTHFVNGATTKSAELTRIFGDAPSTQKSLANETWNTCQSHSGQNPNHFMPWHRMFVYYFERIIRHVSGRADFTLPYWDYTSDDPTKRGIVPLQFRLASDPIWKYLYRSSRTTLANTGQPIHKYQTTDVMDISDAMAKTHYSTVNSVMGFCRAIDSGIHGRIHVLVGTSKNMGAVPYAGNDPLFWVHHSNIDRMWASWNENGNTNPTTATWAGTAFTFCNAGGVRVRRALRDFFATAPLGYEYDNYIGAPMMMAKLALASPGTQPAERVARTRGAAQLGPRPTLAVLAPTLPPRSEVLGLDPSSRRRSYLVLRNLHTWKQPEVLFHVYLSPGANGGRLDRAAYVGNIHFFDAEFHDHGDAQLDTALGENFYSFDVTELLNSLKRNRVPNARDALTVTIVPAGRPTPGGEPMVGTVELVLQ